jgi:hypothetical protein
MSLPVEKIEIMCPVDRAVAEIVAALSLKNG